MVFVGFGRDDGQIDIIDLKNDERYKTGVSRNPSR